MARAVLKLAVVAGLSSVLAGCGGGESGPRGGTSMGGPSGGDLGAPTTPTTLRTVAYMPSYRGQLANWTRQLEFLNMTYVNLSFLEVDELGNVRFPDPGLAGFVASAQAAGVKVCAALGGAGTIDTGGVFATLLTDAQRPAFVEKLVKYTLDNNLDCLDIDLEGNGVNEYYEVFVTDLEARLKPQGVELTAAVAGWFGDRITDRALQSFDFINVMAYDLYHNNRVPDQYSSIDAATAEVDKWVARMPREKVVYGVPFYGMRWPNGGGNAPEIIGYSDLLRADASAATQDQLQTTDTVTFLNSRLTIQAKAKLAATYGGIMVWEATQDATGDASLFRAIREAVE